MKLSMMPRYPFVHHGRNLVALAAEAVPQAQPVAFAEELLAALSLLRVALRVEEFDLLLRGSEKRNRCVIHA